MRYVSNVLKGECLQPGNPEHYPVGDKPGHVFGPKLVTGKQKVIAFEFMYQCQQFIQICRIVGYIICEGCIQRFLRGNIKILRYKLLQVFFPELKFSKAECSLKVTLQQ